MMYYYVIRDRKGEMISVFKDNVKVAARSVVVRITKAEFDTYLEFGIEELDASEVIITLFDRLGVNKVAMGSTC